VSSGGTAVDPTILSGGTALIARGGMFEVVGVATIAAGAIAETLAGGTALVRGAVHNSGGTLLASGASSLIEIVSGAVVSGGLVEIGNGTIGVRSGGTANVFFAPTGSGGLIVADMSGSPAAYNGTVSGFGGVNHGNHAQFIELANVSFGASLASSYISTGPNSGTLLVSSGGQVVASIQFLGSYSAGNFHITAGTSGTVKIADPGGVTNGGTVSTSLASTFPRDGIDLPNMAFGAPTTLADAQNNAGTGGTLTLTDSRHAAGIILFGNYMAGSFATAPDGHGCTLVTAAEQTQQPLLARPRG
jgi:hypothetical protein